MHHIIVFYGLLMRRWERLPHGELFTLLIKVYGGMCVISTVKKQKVVWMLIGQYSIPAVVKYRYDVQHPYYCAAPID